MIIKIKAPHRVEEWRAYKIRQEMLEKGPPTIRAVLCSPGNYWRAVEGSHRLAAAADLGCSINLVPVQLDEFVPGHGNGHVRNWQPAPARELLADYGEDGPVYELKTYLIALPKPRNVLIPLLMGAVVGVGLAVIYWQGRDK
jgi:hypothetical protein